MASSASLGGLYYLYETIRGTAKPNRITWLLWGIFPMITFFAQQSNGVGLISWVSFISGAIPIVILFVSLFNDKAYWKTQNIDYICMFLAVIGISMWAITANSNLAIAFSILAGIFAGIPTYIKGYRHPESESWIAYAISTIGFLFTILTIQKWTFANYAFVIHLTLGNGIMALLSSRKKVN